MRIFAGLMVIGFMIVGAGCSDPDVVPESHISAPPENPVSVEPETVEQFPLNTALFGDLHVHTSWSIDCLLYTSPSPRDAHESRMPSSA